MSKQKWRRACYAALEKAGHSDLHLYFERNGKEYISYWGMGDHRAEVVLLKDSGEVNIFELQFASIENYTKVLTNS